jgi:hypothetical protein
MNILHAIEEKQTGWATAWFIEHGTEGKLELMGRL